MATNKGCEQVPIFLDVEWHLKFDGLNKSRGTMLSLTIHFSMQHHTFYVNSQSMPPCRNFGCTMLRQHQSRKEVLFAQKSKLQVSQGKNTKVAQLIASARTYVALTQHLLARYSVSKGC